MKHPIFVGYFDVSVRSSWPKARKPIDLGMVLSILAKHCDKERDGFLVMAEVPHRASATESVWLGRIEHEDVHFERGYLICPWLRVGFNRKSISFMCELYHALGVQIFEQGDCVFLSPEQLANTEFE